MFQTRNLFVLMLLVSTFVWSAVKNAESAMRVVNATELNILAQPKVKGRFNSAKTSIVPVELKVVVVCKISSNGKLKQCKILEEFPRGWHAGGYAIRMAESMRVSASLKDGSRSAGVWVRLPFIIH